MMVAKIEKGIPLPPRGARLSRKWPWHEMEVGDSFLVPAGERATGGGTMGKFMGRKFTERKLPDGSIRIWRTA